ncbi:MAG: hypothetical protein AB1589_20160 [Cyanobacteriota bacterium]
MKHYLKIAINFVASLFVMVSGTMQAAQADEVWLDFSVPEADIVLASAAVKSAPEAVPKAFNSQPSNVSAESLAVGGTMQSTPPQKIVPNTLEVINPSVNVRENATQSIALDFGVTNTTYTPVPVVPQVSAPTIPNNPELKPPPLKTEAPPSPKPSLKPPGVSMIKTPASKLPSGKTTSQRVTALRRAIIGQESAGKFWLVNPDSGALGYGQLLRVNVAPWTKAALGRALTPEEFLANPKLQIKTIDHKLNEYLKRQLVYTGGKNEEIAIRRVASTWYSGNPNLWNNTRPQYSNGRRYPSIASYTRSVWKRYLREIG